MRGLCLGLLLAGPALAETAYEGDALAALHCADYFATAALALEDELDEDVRAKAFTISVYILAEHVPGSWPERDAAMKQIVARRSEAEAIAGYRAQADTCLERFPVSP